MNYCAIFGLFVILILVPFGAYLNEHIIRRNGYEADIDGTIQGNRRLRRHDESKRSPDHSEGISPDPRPPVSNVGRVA